MLTGAGDFFRLFCVCGGSEMRLIEEGSSAWLGGLMLIAGGAAALYVGDIYLKSLGLVSLIAGLLFIYLDWRISKELEADDS